MAKRTPLTYKEFIDLAQKYYYKGGDSYVECWDEKMFNEWVEQVRPIYKTSALEMFRRNLDEERDQAAARRWYAGEGYEGGEY
jgi:hypothetical protein